MSAQGQRLFSWYFLSGIAVSPEKFLYDCRRKKINMMW